MKLQILNRKVHYWASAAVAIPILVVIVTGLMLQTKKYFAWVQPPEHRGTGTEPAISFAEVIEICRQVPEAGVAGWDDVNRVDVRPSRGMLKVTTKSNYEIQIDTETGGVLQVAYRRSDTIEALHDGSWFADEVKLWVFLPTGLVLLGLWLTGIYLFVLPFLARRRSARRRVPTRT